MDTFSFAQAPISVVQAASLRNVYLSRLQRLVRLRSQHEQELNGRGILLLDRSIFSAYYACRNNGMRSEAGRILHESQTTLQAGPESVPEPLDGLARQNSIEHTNDAAPSQATSRETQSNESGNADSI